MIVTGDTNGYLSPCGCTKPMTGGIKRRVEAAKELGAKGHTTLLDNGNLVAGEGRQDQIKAQTAAEILGAAGWDAINVGPADARLGLGFVLSMNGLANGKFVASGLQTSQESNIQKFIPSPPFFVIGIAAHPEMVAQPLGQIPVAIDDAIKDGMSQASAAQLTPVLLLQGTHDEAKQIASQFPDLKLIVYSSQGSPPTSMEKINGCAIVSPGSDDKYVLRLTFSGGQFSGYQSIALGPQYKDDPTSARLYRTYLSRISSEHLIDALPRIQTARYSGSKACGVCHRQALHVWQTSLHPHALQTLAARGENLDPECLPCHVVGLTSVHGFTSTKKTPDLAGVGCESCHGPGAAHSKSPKTVRFPKVTQSTCFQCHTSNTSPNFQFAAFWKKIKH